jgi:hypothetical protein
MEQKTWQGFLQPAACHPSEEGLGVEFKGGSSALLPVSLPDFVYCRDLIQRHLKHGLPVWVRTCGDTIELARFARVATVLPLTAEPLDGAFLLFSDSPGSQHLADNHPERERQLAVFSTALGEGRAVLYALEEEGLIADAELVPARAEAGATSAPTLQQTPV